jgi:TolA-binding protein
LALALAMSLYWLAIASAQNKADQEAAALLNNAQKAFTDKNYPAAGKNYRDFLTKFAGHKDATTARYGLGLVLLETPNADYAGAAEQLQALAGNKESAEYPLVIYNLALAQRGLGIQEQIKATAAAAEAPLAKQRFMEAGKQFAVAAEAFSERAKKAKASELSSDAEWSIRSRCDQAEMILQIGQVKEAQGVVAPLVKDPALIKSRYRRLALYYDGLASFLLKDYLAAGRSLSLLTPFMDQPFGNHARYLLARVHQLQDERAEAIAQYDAVLSEYDRQKRAAIDSLKRPESFRNNPAEKARLETLARETPPDYVACASFYLGVLNFEGGRFSDAQGRFANFAKAFPKSPLAAEAQLHLGFCLVQLKQYPEAAKTLQPLVEKEPQLADQTLFWLGKAQAGVLVNAQNVPQAVVHKTLETLRQAAAKAQERAATDADARARHGSILLELADTQQLVGQYKEAAATYEHILATKAVPERDEEVLQRLATALNLAGDYAKSDQACARYLQAYPKSPLLPAVLFRQAENAGFQLQTAEKNAQLPNRSQEIDRLSAEAVQRYQKLIDKAPDFPYANLARYQIAMVHYRKGDLEKARDGFETIPGPDRAGDLAIVPYLLADCLIRLTPLTADDALTAGRVQEQMTASIALLDSFIGSQPKGPLTPDALMKIGYCYQRQAALLAQPPEKAKALAIARAGYKKIYQEFPNHELLPNAVFEEAKCFVQLGNGQRAIEQLRRFTGDPLKQSRIAPMALLQMATLLRAQNKAADAAVLLAQCREAHESALLKDTARNGWAAQLQYHHGVALREAVKVADAQAVFASLAKQFPNAPEAADAALRLGQCLKEEGQQKVDKSLRKLFAPDTKAEEIAALLKGLDEESKSLRAAAQYLERSAEQLKQKQPTAEARARILYEAAWANRLLADIEIAAAKAAMLPEAGKKSSISLADIPLSKIAVQPTEKQARLLYQSMIVAFADLPLSNDARLELGELLADRGDIDPAIKLFSAALDKEPTPDLTDRIRLRLGVCLSAKGNAKAAVGQFESVAKRNPKTPGPLAGPAYCLAGEALMQAGEWQSAAKQLVIFRDQQPYRNLPGWSDRALFRLGQAQAQFKAWDQSRDAYNQVVTRFGNSPWAAEARYNMGWTAQQQKDYENAARAYTQAAAGLGSPLAVKAQLQIGLCRMEQKRWQDAVAALSAVPAKPDTADIHALALVEVARAQAELKQRQPAEKLLQQVVGDYPKTKAADVAKQHLKSLADGTPLKRPDLLNELTFLAPEIHYVVALPLLGQPKPDRASLDDPTAAASLASIMTAIHAERSRPADFLRLSLPDPFEHRLTLPKRLAQADAQLPVPAIIRPAVN